MTTKKKTTTKKTARSKAVAKATTPADPALKLYERAVRAVHGKKWDQAKQLLAQVLEETDQIEVVQRVQQFQDIVARKGAQAQPHIQDAYLKAVYERNRGDLKTALALCNREGRAQKDERFAYLAATIHASNEDYAAAAEALGVAIQLNPKNRFHAQLDSDFAELRDQEEYSELFQSP